jgi:AcrR family transcriptional regulator
MNLRKNDTKDRIVEAAVQLFSRQGYSGTSTREIARLADVNEASLFHHFARKQDLFWAALQGRIERLRVRRELWDALRHPGSSPEVVLPLVVELLVHLTSYHRELIRLFMVGFLEMRPATERLYRQEFGPLVEAIGGYLTHAVKRGVLHDLDPALTTVMFTTGIMTNELLWPLFGGTSYANAEEAVSAHSRYWLNALVPDARESMLQKVLVGTGD